MPVAHTPHGSSSRTFAPPAVAHALIPAGVPGGGGQTGNAVGVGNDGAEAEKDPFLSLLEQLAENEHSRGGPSELDYYLSAAGEG